MKQTSKVRAGPRVPAAVYCSSRKHCKKSSLLKPFCLPPCCVVHPNIGPQGRGVRPVAVMPLPTLAAQQVMHQCSYCTHNTNAFFRMFEMNSSSNIVRGRILSLVCLNDRIYTYAFILHFTFHRAERERRSAKLGVSERPRAAGRALCVRVGLCSKMRSPSGRQMLARCWPDGNHM
jgi:hypothetical protein